MDRIIDTKYVEGTITFTNPVANGSVAGNFLSGIQLGTSDTSRIGNTIRVKRFWLRGQWNHTGVGIYRLGMYWDAQANGAVPVNSDILTANGVNAGYNHDTVVGHGGSRFTVIHDNRHLVNPQFSGATTLVPVFKTWKGNKVVRYNGNAGTVADLVSNNLVFIANGDAAADFTGQIVIEYQDA